MSLESLLSALQQDARGQAAATIEHARRESSRLRAEAETAWTARREETLAALARELRAGSQARELETRRSWLGRVLAARQGMLDRVLAAAARRLDGAAAGDRFRSAVPNIVSEALSYVGDEPVVVSCPRELHPEVMAAVAGCPRVTVRLAREGSSGIKVEAADGSVVVDATLDARLERLRPLLQIEILRLFDERAESAS